MPKEAVFTLKLESDLRDDFLAEAASAHRPASQLVREFMREFIQRQREVREHDLWFRSQIQAALDDPRPGISNDDMKAKTRALIDRIAAGKSRLED